MLPNTVHIKVSLLPLSEAGLLGLQVRIYFFIRLTLAENFGRWSQPALLPASFPDRKISRDWQPSVRNHRE